MRTTFMFIATLILLLVAALVYFTGSFYWLLITVSIVYLIALNDVTQKKQTIRRNFPVIGHFRYLLESIRPEIAQYFIETDSSGVPFSREERTVVYTRSKKVIDTIPFGTKKNVYEVGYEWINHSLKAKHIEPEDFRVMVGGKDCLKPYSASRMNISAMSFGSLSKNAILALSSGAKMGNFAHNTGEGGISPYHIQGGADLFWQIGTGYFGCRSDDGNFNPELFKKNSTQENVKMIEIKLSQGAKPGHGGILPAAKVTEEISKIRNVPMGKDVLSPPAHTAFSNPIELCQFIKQLRDLSGGKPVGFKICIGRKIEFVAICKGMMETGIFPDFITVDGAEGGTGAAPVEFSNSIGTPLVESLIFVDNVLRGFNIRKDIKVIASGKVTSAFHVIKRLSLGADMVNSARAMMMSLGCIQALLCNTNHCPVGVATQNKMLMKGLHVPTKTQRVANYHAMTIQNVCEMMGAMGVSTPDNLYPGHINRRTSPTEFKSYDEIYDFIKDGVLLSDKIPLEYEKLMKFSRTDQFV